MEGNCIALTIEERLALIELYATGYDEVVAALDGITEPEWAGREGPNEWNPREIVHHLGDGEMNAASRIKFLIAEKEPLIPNYDQDRWTDILFANERPIEPSLAALRAAREATVPLLRLITEEQWKHEGSHTTAGTITAETWLEWYGPHAHDHADQIRRAQAAAR